MTGPPNIGTPKPRPYNSGLRGPLLVQDPWNHLNFSHPYVSPDHCSTIHRMFLEKSRIMKWSAPVTLATISTCNSPQAGGCGPSVPHPHTESKNWIRSMWAAINTIPSHELLIQYRTCHRTHHFAKFAKIRLPMSNYVDLEISNKWFRTKKMCLQFPLPWGLQITEVGRKPWKCMLTWIDLLDLVHVWESTDEVRNTSTSSKRRMESHRGPPDLGFHEDFHGLKKKGWHLTSSRINLTFTLRWYSPASISVVDFSPNCSLLMLLEWRGRGTTAELVHTWQRVMPLNSALINAHYLNIHRNGIFCWAHYIKKLGKYLLFSLTQKTR